MCAVIAGDGASTTLQRQTAFDLAASLATSEQRQRMIALLEKSSVDLPLRAPQLQTISGVDQPRLVERSMSEFAPRAFRTKMCVQNPPTALNCRQWTTRQHCVTCTCMSMTRW
jgi:hypothetical protein